MTQFSIALLAALDAAQKREEFFADIKPMVTEKKFYTQKDLSARYKVTMKTIKTWAKAGKLVASMKIDGGTVRYTQEDLDKFEKMTGRKENAEE